MKSLVCSKITTKARNGERRIIETSNAFHNDAIPSPNLTISIIIIKRHAPKTIASSLFSKLTAINPRVSGGGNTDNMDSMNDQYDQISTWMLI